MRCLILNIMNGLVLSLVLFTAASADSNEPPAGKRFLEDEFRDFSDLDLKDRESVKVHIAQEYLKCVLPFLMVYPSRSFMSVPSSRPYIEIRSIGLKSLV